MAVVTRDSTQGWQSKGLYGGTTEDRYFSWANRCVPALENGEWLNIYWMIAKAPIASCQVHALHNSDRGIRRPHSRGRRIVIQCATDAPVSFRRGMAACRSFNLAGSEDGRIFTKYNHPALSMEELPRSRGTTGVWTH